jgi:ribosomal protein S18 acetylase RimI-like enzyme
MNLTIRPASQDVAAAVSELLETGLGYAPDSLSHIAGRLADHDRFPDLYVLVAVSVGAVVGVATSVISYLLDYEAPQARVNAIATDPSHRRSGVDRSLVTEVERLASELGCFHVELTSSHDLVEAHEESGNA